MASYQLLTAPTSEPLTLAEAKLHLNIPDAETYHDSLITNLITSARMSIEQLTYRGLMTQTQVLHLDSTEIGEIVEISKVPLQSISSFKYYDQDNTQQTLSSSNYILDNTVWNVPARLQLLNKFSVYKRINAVQIEFVCGWTSAALVPEPIKSAMKLIIGHLYEHRESVTMGGSPAVLPLGVQNLINPYSLNWFYREL